ncbi:ReoY family proteolytic degradation factor [Shouchella sp. 1P09AA]|uniref:ReoY family proteolytic degradation factor n=1 Tax=unclassified Shouchella TaxID=2893065 RepID=UPI00399FEA9F
MGSIIPVMDKKSFLRSFLKRHQLKRRECAWLLNYLMNDDGLMERVHFLDRSDETPKALVISAQGIDTIPFSFRKQHHVTTDCEKAFHDIRLNHTEEIYIELHFKDQDLYAQYLAVLEDNPYLPETKERKQRFEHEAEAVLDESIRRFQLDQLHGDINKALDDNDKELFLTLTSKLNDLLKNS